MAVGCEGDGGFPLTPSALVLDKMGAAKPAPQDTCSDLPNGRTVVQALLDAVNAERARHHLRPLRLDTTLTQVAEFYACRMIDGGFFGHEDPFDGSTFDVRDVNFGYAYRKVGENLAVGHDSVRDVVADWMRSPTHRANILDPAFTEIGLAVKRGGEYGVYWVQEFGRPLAMPTAEGSTSALADDGGGTDGVPEASSQPVSADTGDK